MMTILMAGEYWIWRHVFGLSFANESHRSFLVWILTFTFTALPFLAIGIIARRALSWFIEDPLTRVAGLFIILYCNQLWGFSRTLNNHVPSAFFMFLAMITAIGLAHGKIAPKPWLFCITGLAAGLLPTFDLPGMFFCIPLFLYLLWWFPRQTLSWFLLGALPPLILHFALTYSVSGSLIPIYLRKELYSYPGSYWDHMAGFDALEESKDLYFFHLSVGRKGLFSLFPVLILPFASFIYFVTRSKQTEAKPIRSASLRLEQAVLCLLTLFWLFFYTFTTNNYGGMCYGFRWFMFFTPSLAFFSVFAIDRMKSGWGWGLLCLLLAVSFYSGWQCSVDPWTANEEWPTRFLGKWVFK